MKIAIASDSESIESNVSMQGGRAKFYLVFENNKLIETIKNPFAVGSGGAGFGVAKMLPDKGVKKALAGKIGPNMVSALKQRNVEAFEFTGPIKEALKEING